VPRAAINGRRAAPDKHSPRALPSPRPACQRCPHPITKGYRLRFTNLCPALSNHAAALSSMSRPYPNASLMRRFGVILATIIAAHHG
jgi:hypothetical protein